MRIRFLFLLLASFFLFQGAVLSIEEKKTSSEQEFCRLDKNNDREITVEEFKDCEFYKLERIRALPYKEPQELRPKGNAMLSDEELKAYLFKKIDKNKDNKIDRKEWEEFYNSLIEQGGGISHGQ